MSLKIEIGNPKTQALDAVKALLAWKGRSSNPLPSFIEMGSGDSRLMLVLSNNKDAYYTVTSRDCSCPAHNWHPGQRCKHQRKYFAEHQATAKPAAVEAHRPFKPFIENEARPAKAAASSLSAIDCHDTSDMDVAYHSIKADREMWPLCEA
jgi:hypothetical protein